MNNPTPEQSAIFTAVSDTTDNLSVSAVAGSGKTTTIVHAASLPALPRAIFVAFNKSIADELKTRLPSSCEASTFHSRAFSVLRSRGRFNVDDKKIKKIVRRLWDIDEAAPYARLLGLAKANNLRPGDLASLTLLMETTDSEVPEGISEVEFLERVDRLFQVSIDELKDIDFDDMLYLPVHFKWYDPIPLAFVDEVQDLSPIQHEFILNSAKRLVAVGDPRQAIYAFRGADSSSMQNLSDRANSRWLPLSVSWRCPSSVVAAVKHICPQIKAAPNAPEGIVTSGPLPTSPTSSDLILCRTNGPIFRAAMGFIRDEVPFRILGKFPRTLAGFVNSLKAKTIPQLKMNLEGWWREQQGLFAEKPWRLAAAQDKYEALSILIGRSSDIGSLKSLIYSLQDSHNGGCTLSTVHSAKGMEADNVYILRPDLMPSPYATTPSELEQEENLRYVAYTRAKRTLTLVE